MAGISKRVSGSWVSGDYGIMKTATDTITTLPAVIYPNSNSVTIGVKGNTVQNGTPTPQNPVDVNGTGERTGNLCPSSGWEAGQYANGVWDTTTQNRITSPFFAIEEGKQYTITINSGTKLSWINLNYFDSSKQWLGNRITLGMAQFSTASQLETTPNMPTGSAYMRVTVRPYNNVGNITINDIPTADIVANQGSTALPYEPYGYKILFLLNSDITNIYIGDEPLRKSLDGTAVDELAADGTLTRRVDSDGSVLATPVVTQITMPTFTVTAGETTLDVQTTVQPSEVTATYEGWHMGTVHERKSGTWD